MASNFSIEYERKADYENIHLGSYYVAVETVRQDGTKGTVLLEEPPVNTIGAHIIKGDYVDGKTGRYCVALGVVRLGGGRGHRDHENHSFSGYLLNPHAWDDCVEVRGWLKEAGYLPDPRYFVVRSLESTP